MVGTGDSGNLYKSMQEYMGKQRLIWHEDTAGSNPAIPIGLLCVALFIMDFSLLTTSGVSQKRNEAVGNTKPPAMRVEDKLLYKKITFPL